MRIGEPAFFIVFGFYKVKELPSSVMIVAVFSCFSARNTTQNHKNISFLKFFCENIWWYILFDISLQCQNKITNN